MKVFGKFFNWYFGRGALPYWCIMIFDLIVCFLSGVFIVWLRHPASDVLAAWPQLMHTLGLFAVLNFISFRVFHTYSGILRYSQFIDLMRVTNACVLSMLLAFVFSLCALNCGWDDFFFIFTGRKIITMYLGNILAMCIPRVLVKLIFDDALVSSSAMNTLVYGTRAGSIAITNNVRDEKPVHFLIKGYVGDDREHYNERLMGKKIYSVHEDLIPVIESQCIKAFLVSPLRHEEFTKNHKLQDLLIERGIKIFVAQNAEEWKKNQDPQEKVSLREVKIEDLLPREEIQVDMDSVGALLRGKRVLITGAAGSIGSEMVRQIAIYKPAEMMLIDQAETPLHDVRLMMKNNYSDIKAETVVTSICKEDRMVKYGVKKFVMISTDKAVNPTTVMGCSKRICEIYVQSLDKAIKDGKIEGVTQFVTTRFGNVLGSNGSVIPLFREQLAKGGPLTVTHPKIIRFFMLIPEACKLVLEAGTHGKGGEIFVFDIGEPVRIADLAKRMIQLSGAKNVEIKYTGLREGEKLYEELLNENENTLPSFHKKIRIAMVRNYEYEDALREIEELRDISVKYDDMETVRKMKQIVPEYVSKHSRYEVLDAPQAEAAEVAQSAS